MSHKLAISICAAFILISEGFEVFLADPHLAHQNA
jgi:hypothetical protein